MIVIVCLDKKRGMMFAGRRQSQDKRVRKCILRKTAGKTLWMNEYSYNQFEDELENICVAEDYLERAQEGEYCFVEDCRLEPYLEKIEEIIVYHWNREYPSDKTLDIDLRKWKRNSKCDFVGNSHKKITEEVLRK